jgi:hypothetical protein
MQHPIHERLLLNLTLLEKLVKDFGYPFENEFRDKNLHSSPRSCSALASLSSLD